MRAHRFVIVLPLVGAVVAGCGDDGGEPPSVTAVGCAEAVRGEVTIAAQDLAWTPSCLEAAPGSLTIVVDNRDDGVNHNLHLTDAPGEPETDLDAGPVRQELTLDLEPGDYRFVCDIHPNMVGLLSIADANSG